MHGTISAANRADRSGAVLTIRLPIPAAVQRAGHRRMNATPIKVLVIDDEPPIRKLLRMGLSTQGYEILEASNGKIALELLAEGPALIILDLGLPDIQGHELLRMIRGRNDSVPIVVLSSRGDEAGKVQALDLGADDYLTKPFGMDELLARMRAALRHQLQVHGERPVFRSGDLSVDLVRRIVKVGEREVKLSPKEYELLRVLVQHAGKVLTHRFLLKELWDELTDAQYLRVYVRQLRQKIEADPERPQFVLTETGIGYRLRARGLACSGNFPQSRGLFPGNRENDHGTKIFEEGLRRRRTRDEEAQGRHIEERPLRQEGQEPQAGDRDRPVRGARRGQEGAEEGREEAEDGEEAEGEEVTHSRASLRADRRDEATRCTPGYAERRIGLLRLALAMTVNRCVLPRLARPRRRAVRLLGARRCGARRDAGAWSPLRRRLALQALLQRIHQADDVVRLLLALGGLDRLAGGLALAPAPSARSRIRP